MSPGARVITDLRGAVTAARIGAPGSRTELVRLLTAEADRYARQVLLLPDADARVAVAEAVRHVGRRRSLPTDDDLVSRLHLAVRHEAWRRQPGVGARTRVLAAAALVLVIAGFGVFALSLGADDGAPPVAVSAESDIATVVLEGRVVADDDTVGEADVEVQVLADGKAVGTARTDDDGRFSVPGLAEGVYDLRVTAPGGLQLPGGTATVDLTDRDAGAVVLRLERP